MEQKKLTGYPSIDKPWLDVYEPGAFDRAADIAVNKTVWDVIEESLEKNNDIPAIQYMNRTISREEYRDLVYIWARTFRALGVEENEIVPIYGVFFPDIYAMTHALNMIGATAYFLKLAIAKEELNKETKDAKIAVVYDGMWNNVKDVFQDDRFKKIIVVSPADAMVSPQKEIVSFLSYISAKKAKSTIPNTKKYLRIDEAKTLADYYTGKVKADFVPNRNAFITSSSGTTVGGVVKGCIATNESVIAQLYQNKEAGVNCFPGKKCLSNFPPTASTSLNCLFNLPLFMGMTILNDPRVGESFFYNQIINDKPSCIISTGSMWEAFFNRIEKDLKNGKKYDFSFSDFWIIGGEGTNIAYFNKWNDIMRKCNAPYPLFSGYGLSEMFSTISADSPKSFSNQGNSRPVMGVGLPYPGIDVGIFGKDGNELPYNTRGEVCAKAKSNSKGYYNKDELTNKVIIDGWVHTGDLGEIDEKGNLYIWGRLTDTITLENGEEVYLFDVSGEMKKCDGIDDVIITTLPISNNKKSLLAHIVWNANVTEEEKMSILKKADQLIEAKFHQKIKIDGYLSHDGSLPYSPTTLKKDKNKLSKITTGFKKVVNNEVLNVYFVANNDGTYYKMQGNQ